MLGCEILVVLLAFHSSRRTDLPNSSQIFEKGLIWRETINLMINFLQGDKPAVLAKASNYVLSMIRTFLRLVFSTVSFYRGQSTLQYVIKDLPKRSCFVYAENTHRRMGRSPDLVVK